MDGDNLERFLATTKAVAIAALAHQWQFRGQPRTEKSTLGRAIDRFEIVIIVIIIITITIG